MHIDFNKMLIIQKTHAELMLSIRHLIYAYLMLFAALTNAVCLYNASFFPIDFCKCFLFSCFVFVY